jgi:hypothetical protein
MGAKGGGPFLLKTDINTIWWNFSVLKKLVAKFFLIQFFL